MNRYKADHIIIHYYFPIDYERVFIVSWGRRGVQHQTKNEHVQHFFIQIALSQKLKVRGGRGKSIQFGKVNAWWVWL